jgi:hypothetical protein
MKLLLNLFLVAVTVERMLSLWASKGYRQTIVRR